MKSRKVMATIEFESTLSLKNIKENILTLFEIYDETEILQVVQIQLNVIKERR